MRMRMRFYMKINIKIYIKGKDVVSLNTAGAPDVSRDNL